MQQQQLVKKYGITPEARMLIARLCDLASRAHAQSIPQYTDFLSPAERAVCAAVTELRTTVDISFDGGYPHAERTRAVILPQNCPYTADPPVAVLALEYKGEPLSHRDLLGALMALGIKREKTGDIIAHAQPPILLCDPVIAPYIIDHLERAGKNRVIARPACLTDIPAPKTEDRACTVKSIRLDSIVAEGFSLPRAKAADAIRQGLVFLNWLACTTPGKDVAVGDTITLRGAGKLTIVQTGGVSRKGRIYVTLRRFI